MKDYRQLFFQRLKMELLDKSENKQEVYLYFIKGNQLFACEVEIDVTGRLMIKYTEELHELFKKIDKRVILNQLAAKYKDQWRDAYDSVSAQLARKENIKPNRVAQVILGPFYNLSRAAQSYNIYLSFYFSLQEVAKIVDFNKVKRYEQVIINGKSYYTIDDTAKSLKLEEKLLADNANTKTPIAPIQENQEEDDRLLVESLAIEHFVNLNKTTLAFAPGINLFIGKNGVGKTNVLKLLYVMLRALQEYSKQRKLYGRSYAEVLSQKIRETFQASKDKLGGIVSKTVIGEGMQVKMDLRYLGQKAEEIKFSLLRDTTDQIAKANIQVSDILEAEIGDNANPIFIPSKEVLGIHDAIRKSYSQFIQGFDATYNDLVQILHPFVEEGGQDSAFQTIVQSIEKELLEGQIEYNSDSSAFFFRNSAQQVFEMTMTAEGIKQLGIIPVLIKTGQLRSGSILFLDEPDNNLSPWAIKRFIQILVELAQLGVQVFLNSHSYFVINRLHIEARKLGRKDFMKIFSMKKMANGLVDVETRDLQEGLPKHNPILDESMALFNDEINLSLGHD
jgi:predicted ATPase